MVKVLLIFVGIGRQRWKGKQMRSRWGSLGKDSVRTWYSPRLHCNRHVPPDL